MKWKSSCSYMYAVQLDIDTLIQRVVVINPEAQEVFAPGNIQKIAGWVHGACVGSV